MWALFKCPSITSPPPHCFCLHPYVSYPPSLSWLPHNLPASSLAPFNPVCVQQLSLENVNLTTTFCQLNLFISPLQHKFPLEIWPLPTCLASTPSTTLSSYLPSPPESLQEICPPPAGHLCLVGSHKSCILQDPGPMRLPLGGLPRLHTELALCSLLLELFQSNARETIAQRLFYQSSLG